MTAKRFMIDDCGTLMDMQTRDTFDYVSDVCVLLNELHEENTMLKLQVETKLFSRRELEKENEQLKKQLESEHTMLDNAILLERTRMGQNSLKQYKEAIQ